LALNTWNSRVLQAQARTAQPDAPPETAERLVIVDDDTAMLQAMVAREGVYRAPWLRITDPDGGLEMLYLLREPTVRLLGISCTMGCSTTDVCMASVRKLLDLTGRTDVPLVRGATAPQELGKPTDAARFIIDSVMSHPGQVEIIATAPLTNIATALMLEPRLAANWKMLHLATGEFWGALGKWSDGATLSWWTGLYQDLNINVDVAALEYVLQHAGPNMRIYPNEIMDEAFLTRADRRALQQAGTPLSTWVASETWLMGTIEGMIMKGFALHGVIGAAVAIAPELADPPRTLRLQLKNTGRHGFVFERSDDPKTLAYPVYTQLRDASTIERRLVERCQ
jgi:inosine-uridine nucleoside N-ribohydrolase